MSQHEREGPQDDDVETPEPDDSAEPAPKVLGKRLDELKICYLSCPQDGANRFLGAVLLTDYRTRPLQYIYVDPVAPTKMQRLLYGKTLEDHLNIDVIAKRLLDGLSVPPDLILVDAELLLRARRLASVPVAFLSATDKELSTSKSKLRTVVFRVLDGSPDEDLVSAAIAVLEPLVPLCEPFDRIRDAINETLKSKA